jgi:hypothetical protein
VSSRLLQQFHHEKNRHNDKKAFRFYLLAQAVQFGALFLLLLGGLFFIVLAIYAIV